MTLPAPPSLAPLPFAKLAPSAYLTAHLSSSNPLRPSNRTALQPREPHIHTGSLSHAHGSAVVRAGDTSAVCSVRGEILKRDDIVDWTPPTTYEGKERTQQRRRLVETKEIAHLNLLVPNVELATGCSPANIPSGSGAPSVAAQVLGQRIETLLHAAKVVPMKALEIWASGDDRAQNEAGREDLHISLEERRRIHVKAYWVLYIDITFLSLDGPPMDVAWLAMIAALLDTKLPQVGWDWDAEEVISKAEWDQPVYLSLWNMPVVLSFGVFLGDADGPAGKRERRRWILADLDGFEEGLCKETFSIAIRVPGHLIRIEKEGGGNVGVEELRECVEEAETWSQQCVDILQENVDDHSGHASVFTATLVQ